MSLPGVAAKDGSASPPDAPSGNRFPRAYRLTARRQFISVYERGRRVSCAYFTLYGFPNTAGHPRLGLTVTRKLGGAIRRNRIKRRIREVFRRNFGRLSPDLDVVVNVRPAFVDVSWERLEAEFVRHFGALARRFES